MLQASTMVAAHVGVELSYERREVVVLEILRKQISAEHILLVHHEAAAKHKVRVWAQQMQVRAIAATLPTLCLC